MSVEKVSFSIVSNSIALTTHGPSTCPVTSPVFPGWTQGADRSSSVPSQGIDEYMSSYTGDTKLEYLLVSYGGAFVGLGLSSCHEVALSVPDTSYCQWSDVEAAALDVLGAVLPSSRIGLLGGRLWRFYSRNRPSPMEASYGKH